LQARHGREFKVGEKEARLREIRKEIGALLDEANLLADHLPVEDRAWIGSILDLLEALDAKDALGEKSSL
jgi:hypothetical protein